LPMTISAVRGSRKVTVQVMAMRSDNTLYLHIGRNKAGSTTLQNYWVAHASELRRAGVQYALFGQPSPPGSGLPTFPTHALLADFVRAEPGRAVLVSHEVICCFTPEVTRRLASDLASLNVQLIFYVRPYREWVLSSYNFDVRTGYNGRDFDRYLEDLRPLISFWPMLEIWGEIIGWDNIRVRSLSRGDLLNGDLIADGNAAIAVSLPPGGSAARDNASPSWMVIEMLRTIVGRDIADGWQGTDLAIAHKLHDYTDEAIAAGGAFSERVNYFTRHQALGLADLCNRDLAALAEHTGLSLQSDDAGAAAERPFLPSADRVPKDVLCEIVRLASDPAAVEHHPAVAAFVQTPRFRALCGE
jgi:hypothetical protein